MRIGWVSEALPYLPSRGGFRLYGGNLIKQLSKRHEVELVSFLMADDREHLDWPKQYCTDVVGFEVDRRRWLAPVNFLSAFLFGKPIRSREALNQLIREKAKSWDVMHVEGSFAGGLIAPNLPIPTVLSLHDSEVLRCEELLNCKLSLRERFDLHLRHRYEMRYEKLVYPRYDCCIVVADRDCEVVRRHVPAARTRVISYGTDTEYFHPVPADKARNSLVFHSHLGYAPNVSASLEFANEVLPLIRKEIPDAEYHLVGASPNPEIMELSAKPGIRLSANLPDLRSAVCSGNVYVSAIRYGTGLKSKILEALAMQMPIVCYPGSTVGIEAVHGKHLLVANDPREFSAHVIALLRNPARADELARAGRDLTVERYSWDSRARAYEDLYSELIAERRDGRVAHSAAGLAGRRTA